MKWALRVVQGEHKGKIIPIRTSPFIIGRNQDCQLKASNRYVSQRHCELQTSGNKFLVRDCQSTNGTFVNGQRVAGEVELEPGDRLRITSLTFVVCQNGHQPTEPKQPEHGSPHPPRTVDEDAVGEMLLELDEEETGQNPPGTDAWRNSNSGTADWKSTGPQKLRLEAEKTDPENEPRQTPSQVASEMLRGKGSLLKRKS